MTVKRSLAPPTTLQLPLVSHSSCSVPASGELLVLTGAAAFAADGDAARRILLQAAQNAIKRAGASTTIDKTNVDTGLTQAKAAYEVLSK